MNGAIMRVYKEPRIMSNTILIILCIINEKKTKIKEKIYRCQTTKNMILILDSV